MTKMYKIVDFDLKGGPSAAKGVAFAGALKKAEKNAIQEFEDLINKNCSENNEWRFHSLVKFPFTWGGLEYEKEAIILYNSELF